MTAGAPDRRKVRLGDCSRSPAYTGATTAKLTMRTLLPWLGLLAALPTLVASAQAQGGVCKPVEERKTEVGCWILADAPIGRLIGAQTYWHLDTYLTREDAARAKGPRSVILDALHAIWLLSIDDNPNWRPAKAGRHLADIGPLPIVPGSTYSAMYMEAVFNPGMTAPAHTHSGPEAWYTQAGETCLETPQGKQIGRPGQQVIVPEGLPMHLTATGHTQRRAVVLILHDSSKPPTTMVHDWKPKGLCKTN